MRFGVELEFTAMMQHAHDENRGSFYQLLEQLVLESGLRGWKFKVDGSCGSEIVSPILSQENGIKQVGQVCYCTEVARERFGIKRILGPDCGVHYHFDASDMDFKCIRNILGITAILETLFFAMNPSIRLGLMFAAPLNFNLFQAMRARDIIDIRDTWFRQYMGVRSHQGSYRHANNEYLPHFINTMKRKPEKYDWTRYHGLNLVAYFHHGTMEFRYTHGTFDADVIRKWYDIYRSIVVACKESPTRRIWRILPFEVSQVRELSIADLQGALYKDLRKTIDCLFKLVEPTVEMVQFVAERLAKFNGKDLSRTAIKETLKYDGYNGEKARDILLSKPINLPSLVFSSRQPPTPGHPVEAVEDYQDDTN